MSEVFIVGVDLAKRVFQIHGATVSGEVLFRKKLSRAQFSKFLGDVPTCIVAMEACASAHFWGREAQTAGHDVRLVPVKTPEQQSQAMLFRTREMFVRQRTQTINALRAHLAEFGIVLRLRIRNPDTFAREVEERATELPELARSLANRLLEQIATISEQVCALDLDIKAHARSSHAAQLMQTMPGVGPMSAMAVEAFCPPATNFRSGRDFAAWLGLVPRQHSTGGKERLGRVTKMGQKDVRRLLIIGAMSVINSIERRKRCVEPWLAHMIETRPRMVVAVALANRMARRLWAMLATGQEYRIPGTAS